MAEQIYNVGLYFIRFDGEPTQKEFKIDAQFV